MGDFIAGLYAAYTIAALLPAARSSGRSFHVDCPMLDCLLATSALQTSEYWGSGNPGERLGTAHPRNAPYQAFEASDRTFTVAAGNDRLWRSVVEVTGLAVLGDDPRFATQRLRVKHQVELAGLLQEQFRTRPAAHWLGALRARGVPCGPVNTYADILADDHVRATGLVQDLKVPVAGLVPTVVFPARIAGCPAGWTGRPPCSVPTPTTYSRTGVWRDPGIAPAPPVVRPARAAADGGGPVVVAPPRRHPRR